MTEQPTQRPSKLTADFGATAEDYARHRAGFPESMFERLAQAGLVRPGQDVVDLGTGTGSLARGFARRGSNVVGIDVSHALLEQARALDAREGLQVDHRVGRAEATGLADQAADVVSAGQCWHWFDRPRAAAEAARILRPTGHLLIAHFDWIPLPGNLAQATEALIEAHNPDWKMGGGLGLYPLWLRDLGKAAYQELETFSYDVEVAYRSEDWRGRIRASAGVGGSLAGERVARFDADLAALLRREFPEPVLRILHRVFCLTARPPTV